MKLLNSGKVAQNYFSKGCVEILKNQECDIAKGYYHINGIAENAEHQEKITPEDIKKLKNLTKNGYWFIGFKK